MEMGEKARDVCVQSFGEIQEMAVDEEHCIIILVSLFMQIQSNEISE